MASPASEAPPETTSAAAPEPTEDPDLPSNDDIEMFISAIASSSTSELEAATDLVQADSPAANYLTYYSHNVNAQIDAGLSGLNEPADVEESDNGFQTCITEAGEKHCTSYSDFEGKEGLITDFQVQQRDLADRLAVGSGETISGPDGSEIEFVAAYMNAQDTHLLLAFNVRSGSTETNLSTSSYRGEDGRQSQAEDFYGSWELAPDSMSSYVAMFPDASLGGEAHLDIWTETNAPPTTLTMPTSDSE
ncbi:MAG: hypothetical protein HLX51_02805 [Micrococcaceae bacterium]|nr:hypothetical protein [Micrococcaceae bacterium]